MYNALFFFGLFFILVFIWGWAENWGNSFNARLVSQFKGMPSRGKFPIFHCYALWSSIYISSIRILNEFRKPLGFFFFSLWKYFTTRDTGGKFKPTFEKWSG
jgi:hypothetical protein